LSLNGKHPLLSASHSTRVSHHYNQQSVLYVDSFSETHKNTLLGYHYMGASNVERRELTIR